MNELTFVTDVKYEPDVDALVKMLRVKPGSIHAEELARLAQGAAAVARPKGLYRPAFIESRTEDSFVLDGVEFASRVLTVNLEKLHRVFPYLATCGTELDEWSAGLSDFLHVIWADAIKTQALFAAADAVKQHIQNMWRPGKLSNMKPGSLPDWPITQQVPLFELLGGGPATVGVELLESCFMRPGMTVSGIHFSTEQNFESCMLCPRENCVGRQAPYEPELFEKKYKPGFTGGAGESPQFS